MMVHKTTTHCLSPSRVQTLCKIEEKKKKNKKHWGALIQKRSWANT